MTDSELVIELYEAQADLLDQVVESGELGSTRAEVLASVLRMQAAGLSSGPPQPYVGGQTEFDVVDARTPRYGSPVFEHRIAPVEGKALLIRKGQVLRISQAVGGTCVDFNAYNAADYKESMDCGFTRSSQSFSPGRGEFVWTNAPRGRPMFAILEISASCELDITGHRCNRMYQDLGWGVTHHVNCQDSLAEAIREYGLTPDDVHDSFNMWMATTIDENGRRQFRWNPGRQGDHIDLLALFDVVAAAVICGSGDLVGINNFTFQPIDLTVFDASDDTSAVADLVASRWSGRESQQDVSSMASIPIRSQRRLERDASYVPSYRDAPAVVEVRMPFTRYERESAATLSSTGVYGDTPAEAVRAAFMRWSNSHFRLFKKPYLNLVDP